MSHFEGLFITIYYSVQKQPIGNEPLQCLLHYCYISIYMPQLILYYIKRWYKAIKCTQYEVYMIAYMIDVTAL